MAATSALQKRLRIAGIFVIVGLVIEAICLLWARPIAFVVMVVIGGLFSAIGVIVFLYSIVSGPQE